MSDVNAIRIGAAGVIAVVFAFIFAVDVIGGDDSSGASPSESSGNAVTLSETELLARAHTLSHTAYWVGGRPETDDYELEADSKGSIYIRYLSGDATAGDPRTNSLTVATYPVANASQALEQAAKRAPEGQTLSHHEGFSVLSGGETTNAYVVFDDQPELQVEVYSPKSGDAATLATAGVLTPLP
jgi:hypothetical protein